MGLVDVVIIAAIAVLLALALRSIRRSGGECSSCWSRGSCSAHAAGAPCPAAQDMLRNVEKNLGK